MESALQVGEYSEALTGLRDGSVTLDWSQVSCTLNSKKGVRHLLKNINGRALPGTKETFEIEN
jgi:hypothetical protein